MPEAPLDVSGTLPLAIAEVPLAGLNAGMSLMAMRSRAIADYWKSLAAAREPADFLTLQLGYLTKMADDYAAAFAAVVAPAAEAIVPAAEAIAPTTDPEAPPALRAQPRPSKASAAADERHLRSHDGEELHVRP